MIVGRTMSAAKHEGGRARDTNSHEEPNQRIARPSPSFTEQKRIDDTLRAMLRRTIFHATGCDPTPAELDNAVRREFAALSHWFRRGRTVADEGSATGRSVGGEYSKPNAFAAAAVRAAGTVHDVQDLTAAVRYARLHGIPSVFTAVRGFHERHGAVANAPLLPQCVDEFLCVKRAEARAPMTIAGYRSKLQRFASAYAGKRPSEVTAHEIGDFVVVAKNLTTRRDWWQTLLTFYKWCVGVHYASENPVPLALAKPKPPPGAQLVLTPGEVRILLRQAKHTDQIGFWVLGLFAGLRTEEIRRLQAEASPWSVVRLDSRVIDLPDHVTKTGARLVPILPVLQPWLAWVRKREIPFFPANHFLKCRRLREAVLAARSAPLEKHHRETRPGLRSPIWAFNIARRSYISYRLATEEASYVELANEIGNSEAMIRKNYFRRVNGADARAFFSLTPDRV